MKIRKKRNTNENIDLKIKLASAIEVLRHYSKISPLDYDNDLVPYSVAIKIHEHKKLAEMTLTMIGAENED